VALRAYPRATEDDTPQAMPISQAAREWARITKTRRPHRATLIRWCTKGCRGVRLCGRRAGGAWYVTHEALLEFHRRTNDRTALTSTAIEANPARAGEIAAAVHQLDELIGGPTR